MSIIQNWRLNADESGISGLGKLKNLLTKNNMNDFSQDYKTAFDL